MNFDATENISYFTLAALLEKQGIVSCLTILNGTDAGKKSICAQVPKNGLKVFADGTEGFYENISCAPDLIICGAGHVALALCGIAKTLGFNVRVIDDRPEFVNKERFFCADTLICSDFKNALDSIKNPSAFYAIMTRGHSYDEICLELILQRPFLYVGMMGSKTKKVHTWNNLHLKGFTDQELSRVHAPIGFDLGGQTPEEIAVSVAAELVQVRASLGGSYLDDKVYNKLCRGDGKMIMLTIIEKSGSAPRGPGSRMILSNDGSLAGTIGGGSVEFAAIERARSLFAAEQTEKSQASAKKNICFTEKYNLSSSEAASLGMVCGGSVRVLFESV